MVNCCTIIGVLYRPPDSLMQNDEGLYDLLSKFLGKSFVIMGDYNFAKFDWGKPNTLDLSHKFIDCLGNNFIQQVVDKPTRGSNFLDLILCSEEGIVENLQVGEPFSKSDHASLLFSIVGKVQKPPKQRKFYNYFNADYDVIRREAGVRLEGWLGEMSNFLAVNARWDAIKNDLITLRGEFVRLKGQKRDRVYWSNAQVRRRRVAKRNAWDAYCKSGRPGERDAFLYQVYKNKLNLSVMENRKAKLNFERKLADNIKNDCKSFYSYANSKSRTNKKVGSFSLSSGGVINGDKNIANHLNEYFASVFTFQLLNRFF